MEFLISFWLIAVISLIPLIILNSYKREQRYKLPHNPDHPGITINTIEGKKDIICPKCRCPFCEYDIEIIRCMDTVTTTRIRPFSIFRPIVSTTYEIPSLPIKKVRYRCKNCGWIFK